jgi:hypothetical protein
MFDSRPLQPTRVLSRNGVLASEEFLNSLSERLRGFDLDRTHGFVDLPVGGGHALFGYSGAGGTVTGFLAISSFKCAIARSSCGSLPPNAACGGLSTVMSGSTPWPSMSQQHENRQSGQEQMTPHAHDATSKAWWSAA